MIGTRSSKAKFNLREINASSFQTTQDQEQNGHTQQKCALFKVLE